MAYSDFTLSKIKEKFGVQEQREDLDLGKQKLEAGILLKDFLITIKDLSIRTEKAKSEFIVMPVLVDLLKRNNSFFTIYSGESLNANKELGLVGECDFILAENMGTSDVSTPIITVVEAKKHDIDLGKPQCAAQMLGARLHNEQDGRKIDRIYGCVTTGDMWLFMKLENNVIYSDKRVYYLGEIEELLGAFQTIIDYYKEHLK